MTLAAGRSLAHYEILAPLGAGAMGEVWRARDTRLQREVAIKVLPEHFAADAERLKRFEREARTLASLNHPNVAQIFGVDQIGDTCFLVLELVEGESLDQRLRRGALPVAEALDVARQIAEGLEAAHEAGVIHRDLKPANVVLAPDGRAKLLDFGLAKPVHESRDAATSIDSVLSTEQGRLLGTPTYMAPEQARGRPIDRRVDVWAFGCVLYECLTGARAFSGESLSDVLASVLHEHPALERLPAETPRVVRALLLRCLEKDPRRRLRDIGEARIALERALEPGADDGDAAPAAGGAGRRATLAWAIAALSLLVAVVALFRARGGGEATQTEAPATRSSVVFPADFEFAGGDGSLALSPDGRVLALVASRGSTRNQLWLRPLDSLAPQALAGTEDASYPFWSPDGRSLGFFAGGKLRRMPATGGSVTTICDVREPRGGTWGPDDTIVFAPEPFGPLRRVSATGGTPVAITQAEGQETHRLPHFAADGRHLVYSGNKPGEEGIHWLDLESGRSSRITDDQSEGTLVGTEWLAFVRAQSLMIHPFDAQRGQLTGEPRRLVERVEFLRPRMTGAFTLSGAGTLVYRSDPPSQRLEWYDLDGRSLGWLGDPAPYGYMTLSPDGTRVAAMLTTDDGDPQLWILDTQRGLGSKRLDGLGSLWVIWSPDSREVAYERVNGAESECWIHAIDGAAPDRKIAAGTPSAWSPDGTWIALSVQLPATDQDVYRARADGTGEPQALIASRTQEGPVTYSPDGRWLLVAADPSGRTELYATLSDGTGPLIALNSAGLGGGAWWLADGRVLFVSGSGKELLEVSVTPSGNALKVGEPRPAFKGRELPSIAVWPTADGQRMLAIVPGKEGASDQLTLVQNWKAAIGAK